MVAISPDDELCILVGSATEIKKQNLNFKNVKTFEYTIDDIMDIQFSSEQNYIVFLKSNSNIEIYDSKSFNLIKSIVRTNVSNISTEFNSDQIYFIENDSIFTFRVNDIENNINTLKLNSKNLENILISSTAIYVLIQESNAIKIYDKSSQSIVLTISEDVDNITCIDFSFDDANFIYSNGNKVFVYDLKSKTKIYTYTGIYNQTIDQVKFLRSSNYFIYSTLGELFLKSVSNSSSIIELYQSSMPIYQLKQDQARENFIISGSPAAIFTVGLISKGSWRKTAF